MNPGDAAFHPVAIQFVFEVYVSSQGKLFKRSTAGSSSGRKSGALDRVGTGGSSSSGVNQVSFQGNTLISASSSGGLGRRIRITLDSGFGACDANVLTGKTGAGSASVHSI